MPAYKWFLKRVKHLQDGSVTIEPDMVYYDPVTKMLNDHGQVHLHLLVARQLQLNKIEYQWEGMPAVVKKEVYYVGKKS